jgi:predicted kinase
MADWKLLANFNTKQLMAWASEQDWAQAMRDCQQDQQWHAEGNVWTHTEQVVGQLESVPQWQQIGEGLQQVLIFAALFHDIGKPATSRVNAITGRVHSPGHAVRGEMLARNVLREWNCPFELREQICGLVRFHGKPVYLPAEPHPELELARLSWLTRHDLLYVLALADLRGRQTSDSNRSEDDLLWYRALAVDSGCHEHPRPLANDQARFLLGRRQLSDLDYRPYEQYRCTVTIMSGLPGSGKDTWLQRNRPSMPVVSLDALRDRLGIPAEDNQGRVIQAARQQCREYLRAGSSFALNATNTSRQLRTQWIDLFVSYHARVEIVTIENSFEETLLQNRQRERVVPESILHRLWERSEPVHPLEAPKSRS